MNCKFTLCILKTQLGKTFQAIQRILMEIKHDDTVGQSIHLVFTMNTLLNNKQFSKRLDFIENKYGKGSVVIFASKYAGNYKHVKNNMELLGTCFSESTTPKVIIMCSNKRRYDDGVNFVNIINSDQKHIKRIYIYYDELQIGRAHV